MRIAICQPTYLPWLGFFDLIDQVDTFVLLDTVQFERQSWQQRNRIKTPKGLLWLTVPVVFRGRLGQQIQQVEIREVEFRHKHLRAVELNYGRAAFFDLHFPALSSILQECSPGMPLVDLNLKLLRWLMDVLGLRTPLIRASSLGQEGRRTELLANICLKLGANEYVSPVSSAEYLLGEMAVLTESHVQTVFHNYKHPEYKQLFPPFVAFASVLDLILNEGERSIDIIRSGRGVPLTPERVAARAAEAK
jgi:WbqC-like protein family